jgi:hypothetical protein
MLISQVLNFDSPRKVRLVFHEGQSGSINAKFVGLDESVVQLPIARQNPGNHLCLVPLHRPGISYAHDTFFQRFANSPAAWRAERSTGGKC